MNGMSERQRGLLVVACVAQVFIMALVFLAATKSGSPARAARATSAASSPSLPAAGGSAAALDANPLSVTVDIPSAGALYTVSYPPSQYAHSVGIPSDQQYARLIDVTPGTDEPVYITVVNPGPALQNVWFTVSRPGQSPLEAANMDTRVLQVSELAPGTSHFMFTVPMAYLPLGYTSVIAMAFQDGVDPIGYAIGRLVSAK